MNREDLKAALPMAFSAFFLLAGYAFFRPSANSLFKEVFGAERLPMAMGFGVLGVLLAVWLYARVLSWGGPRKTFAISCGASAALILLHYLGLSMGLPWLVFTGYMLKEAYIVLIIEQYWSFLNSRITSSNARKLFGAVLGISSIGSILGSQVSARVVVDLGSEKMMLFAAGLTLIAALLAEFGFRLAGEPVYQREPKKGFQDTLALKLFRSNPVLKYIFLVIVLTQVFSAVTELRFQSILESSFASTELQNQYENRFWSWVETVGLLLNFVVAPVLLSVLSLRFLHYLFPLLHLGSAAAVLLYPTIETVTLSLLVFKCTDYSLFRAAKEMLYIPFSFDARYRAKEVIDVFGYRAGKGAISFTIAGAQGILGVALSSVYTWIALAAAATWCALVAPLTRK